MNPQRPDALGRKIKFLAADANRVIDAAASWGGTRLIAEKIRRLTDGMLLTQRPYQERFATREGLLVSQDENQIPLFWSGEGLLQCRTQLMRLP